MCLRVHKKSQFSQYFYLWNYPLKWIELNLVIKVSGMFAGLEWNTLSGTSASSTSQCTFFLSSLQAFLASEFLSWTSGLIPQSPLSLFIFSSSFARNLTGLIHTLVSLGQDASLSRNPCSSHIHRSVMGTYDISIIIWLFPFVEISCPIYKYSMSNGVSAAYHIASTTCKSVGMA